MDNQEFIMEEVLTKNYGTPTVVTDKDMLMPIEDIKQMHQDDDIYDEAFTPEPEIENLLQDEACKKAMIAAGGVDKNRGNAEELRHYWTHGAGGAKIRWGTPGDWTRCVRHLSKFLGPRAKGYCQLRHKEMDGVYTGSHLNPGYHKKHSMFSSEDQFVENVITASALTARANDARQKMGLVAAATLEGGSAFSIPLVLPEGIESGDGRSFAPDSVIIRELPLPLLWQIKTGEGHSGSVVVGRIDHMERTENGIGNAYGVFDSGPYGSEAERLVRNGFLKGVSADLDQFEAEEVSPENAEDGDPEDLKKPKLSINHARVMAATIVAKPAFQECLILIPEINSGDPEEELIPTDGIYEESTDSFVVDEALIASGFLASAIPTTPPTDWFEKPALTKATPLTIDDTGRVFGHIAAWHVNHIGMPRATRPPRSRSKYAYFHTGVVRTDSGKDVPVGQLTLAGGHASLNANAAQAAKHYDDTASAIADVHAGEDDYGIWVAGSLRPDATEAQIRALRASAPSGDWRPIGGSLELVAVCQVNVPGFPIARAMVAGGAVMALVAAGAYDMAIMKSEAVMALSMRAQGLNELAAGAPKDLKSRASAAKRALKKKDLENLTASVESLKERAMTAAAFAELTYIPEEVRMEAAKKGHALPDGSFPIETADDVKTAIHAYGRAKKSHRAAVRKHIMKRARQLKVSNVIPESWKTAASTEASDAVASMRAIIASVSEFADIKEATPEEIQKLSDAKAAADKQTSDEVKAAKEVSKLKYVINKPVAEGPTAVQPATAPEAPATPATEGAPATDTPLTEAPGVEAPQKDPYAQESDKYTAKTQPRDDRGKFREVLAHLKQNLGVAGLQDALNQVQHTENLDFAGNYKASTDAAGKLLDTLDRLDSGALNSKALENVKTTAAELGKVISNLPLPFGQDAQKLRFSDLPAGLQDLMGKMIDRVEGKIGKKDGGIATASLKSYMSGADVYSQGEVQSEMSKLLRLLT
jgi:hypothetical protein